MVTGYHTQKDWTKIRGYVILLGNLILFYVEILLDHWQKNHFRISCLALKRTCKAQNVRELVKAQPEKPSNRTYGNHYHLHARTPHPQKVGP